MDSLAFFNSFSMQSKNVQTFTKVLKCNRPVQMHTHLHTLIHNICTIWWTKKSPLLLLKGIIIFISGVEDVLLRISREKREYYMRKLFGMKQLDFDQLIEKKQYWSYSVTSTAILELTSTILIPFMIVCFSGNRYVLNLG